MKASYILSQIYLYDFRRMFSLIAITAAIGLIAYSTLSGVW